MKRIPAVLILCAASCAPARQLPPDSFARREMWTGSDVAQSRFTEGLAFLYAFNHDEATRSFKSALEAGPGFAMAYWAIACAKGPHINNPVVDPDRAKEAWEAITRATIFSGRSDLEIDLIQAQLKRWSNDPKADRAPLDKAYAEAMREVWQRHPQDADVGALFAESLMMLRPWDQWTIGGTPQPGTTEILATLEAVMKLDPTHPLALHLYIHAVEASPEPGKADPAADGLRSINTPGLGHLTHMPSHIDVRRGRWDRAIEANLKAIASDAEYRKRSPEQGFYHIYMAHNRHMLAFASMMSGRSALADRATKEMLDAIPEEFVQAAAIFIDGFYAMPYELHVRFGRWDAMLAEPPPREIFPLSRALWHYARGAAYAAKGDLDRARREQKEFEACRAKIPAESAFGNNTGAAIAGVAEKLLDAEIQIQAGRVEAAVASAGEAVRREDALRYDEPPNWILPTRHVLGAILLAADRPEEAEATYRQEMVKYPDNGWSLVGLARSLEAQGKDSGGVRRRFDAIWREADVTTTSSCKCLPAK